MQVNNQRIQLSPSSIAQNMTIPEVVVKPITKQDHTRVFLNSFHAPEGSDEALDELEGDDDGDSTEVNYFGNDPYDPSEADARAGAEWADENLPANSEPSGE